MRLAIFGAVVLIPGILVLVNCRWFIVEIVEGLVALGLVVGGVPAIAIAVGRKWRAKTSAQ